MVRISRKSGLVLVAVGVVVAALVAAVPAAAQAPDTLTLGTITVNIQALITGGSPFCTGNLCDVKLPVYIKDNTGSPAGVDKAPNRINGYTIEANYGTGAGTSHADGPGGAGAANTCITV